MAEGFVREDHSFVWTTQDIIWGETLGVQHYDDHSVLVEITKDDKSFSVTLLPEQVDTLRQLLSIHDNKEN